MSTVAVVQARMSSARLPGKVLAPLAGAPALQRMLERVACARHLDAVVVATSTERDDDAIADLCTGLGVRCARGPLDDVLARMLRALPSEADLVVRLTGDCPLVDPALVDRHVRAFAERDAEYVTNAVQRTMPDGLDVEVFGRHLLEAAHDAARAPFDREHVTPWIQRTARTVHVLQSTDLSALRWTLDTPADYRVLTAIYDALHRDDRAFGPSAIYRLLLRQPALMHVAGVELDPPARARLGARIEAHLQNPEVRTS